MTTIFSEPKKSPLSGTYSFGQFPPRSDSRSSEKTLVNMADTESQEKPKNGDMEKGAETDGQLPTITTKDHITQDPYARAKTFVWMVVNTLTTVFIVFTNKAIFSHPSFGQCQAAFASFHFFVTGATLWLLSRPPFSLFQAKILPVYSMLPLATSMALNIVGMNMSLQISTITFYQITRVLLTPTVAILNLFVYKKTIPRLAAYTFIPMCLGVALISYYDVKPPPPPGTPIKNDGALGVIVAFGSVFLSGIYTVWVGTYQRRYEVNGFQLLFNQAPLGAVFLLYAVPWTDRLPSIEETLGSNIWGLILLSGLLASLINLSQFYVIILAGAVESTVVGHAKTVCIVLLSAFTGGRVITDKAALGIMLALFSIFAYSAIMIKLPK